MNEQEQPSQKAATEQKRTSRLRYAISHSVTRAISAISVDADREAAIAWLVEARGVLASDASRAAKARELYRQMDSREAARVIARAAREAVQNYGKADLPLAIKVAAPVTAIGAATFGLKGAGIVAFGGAVGLPVVVLLFLGTAGVTSVLEAFATDKRVNSPHARLVMALIAAEGARRYRKAFLAALQKEATVPRRAEMPADDVALLHRLRQMHPTDFERHVMSFFDTENREVGVTAQSNDYGVDGYVIEPDGMTVVQCKRNSESNRVGRPTIQQFKGVVGEQGATMGYVVTTSEFTSEARESASKTDKIELIDCHRLLEWHKDEIVL